MQEGAAEQAWAEATARAIDDAGSSRRALGRALGVSGQSVTEWLNRPAPPPAQVFRIR